MYKLDTTKYPTQEQGLEALVIQPQGITYWKGPYLKEVYPKRPWGIIMFIPIRVNKGTTIWFHTAQMVIWGDGEDKDVLSWEGGCPKCQAGGTIFLTWTDRKSPCMGIYDFRLRRELS